MLILTHISDLQSRVKLAPRWSDAANLRTVAGPGGRREADWKPGNESNFCKMGVSPMRERVCVPTRWVADGCSSGAQELDGSWREMLGLQLCMRFNEVIAAEASGCCFCTRGGSTPPGRSSRATRRPRRLWSLAHSAFMRHRFF